MKFWSLPNNKLWTILSWSTN